MGKVVFGGAVAEMRNSLGNVVYSRNRLGNYARLKTTIPYHNTQLQQDITALWGGVAARWNATLTEAQRRAWIAYAATRDGRGAHLPGHHLTPYQHFLRLNGCIGIHLGEYIDVPPPRESVRDQGVVTTLTCDVSDQKFYLNVTTPPNATEWLVVQTTKNLNVGRNSFVGCFQDNWMWPGDPWPAGPWDMWDWQLTYRELPVAGKKIAVWVRMLDRTTGALTPGAIASCIVTA